MWIVNFLNGLISLNYAKKLTEVNMPCGRYIGNDLIFEGTYIVSEFVGVPYAQPPIKNLRFQNPQPYCKVGEKIYCKKFQKTCPQMMTSPTNRLIGVKRNLTSEDCLYLNVWTPKKRKKLPVLVVFHDGNFLEGSANTNMHNASYFAYKTGTVIVTVNYRLNVFGFAQSQGAYYIPGNMGLKDQQMALKWINKNIKYFNGDKRKVTILGIGSGAASVSAHLMVKESFGLYKKAIMFSGHMANVKYSKSYRTVQDYTEKLINRLKCQKNQLKCLSRLSTHKIMNEASKLYKQMSHNEFGSPFSISLFDKTFFKGHINNKYINLYTFNSYTKILVGHTKNEGSLALLSGLYSYVFVYNSKKWKYDIIVDDVSYKAILNDVVKKLNLKVNNWSTINETYSNYAHNADKIIRLLSDLFNDCDLKTFTFIANQRLKNKIRVLLLDKTPSSLFEEKYEVFGTTPQDIIEYLFGYPFRHPNHYRQNILEDEKNYSLKLMEFISNFTKTYTFDENWKSSDKNIFRERMVNETLSWNKYIILESPLNTNSCKILKDF